MFGADYRCMQGLHAEAAPRPCQCPPGPGGRENRQVACCRQARCRTRAGCGMGLTPLDQAGRSVGGCRKKGTDPLAPTSVQRQGDLGRGLTPFSPPRMRVCTAGLGLLHQLHHLSARNASGLRNIRQLGEVLRISVPVPILRLTRFEAQGLASQRNLGKRDALVKPGANARNMCSGCAALSRCAAPLPCAL